ncbi:hypothetical protein [Nostoc sp. UHCC 0252]|uniref:hypothetical protein n=1 Tax=Nostoc sp. UHCC 0252 TaxID=3110241 RepID=UPI002B20CBF8|nr:hypothetical protein [Nostoc sp. UHCC 0252]MEA5606443.1 hypothetical protein [Nostoc sp. UHCC 0252]
MPSSLGELLVTLLDPLPQEKLRKIPRGLMNLSIQQIVPEDVALMEALLATFGEAFDQVETYGNPPSADYLRQLLDSDYFIAIAALKEGVRFVA